MARSGAGAAPPVFCIVKTRALSHAAFHAASSLLTSGRSTFFSPLMTAAANASESSRNVTGASSSSATPSLNAWAPVAILLLLSGFVMMSCSAFSTPMRFGSKYVPPQPGTRPRKHSGSE